MEELYAVAKLESYGWTDWMYGMPFEYAVEYAKDVAKMSDGAVIAVRRLSNNTIVSVHIGTATYIEEGLCDG